MLAPYAIPRALDQPDRFCIGFTTLQFAWTFGGAVAAVVAYWLLAPVLTPWLLAPLVVWTPVLATFAKRRVYRGWDGLAVLAALWHYTARPKRCVYLGEE